MAKKWNAAELALLKEHFPHKKTQDVANIIGRSYYSVAGKAHVMKLEKSAEFMAKMQIEYANTLRRVGVNTRIKPGTPPPNKGKKWAEYLTPRQMENCRKNTFKKGDLPHNTKYNGYEWRTKDGYTMLRIAQSVAVLKHVHIWEQHHGKKVPPKHLITFKDGNKENFAIENLECISMADNVRRNTVCDTSIVKKFLKIKDPALQQEVLEKHPQLIQLKRKSIQLNSKIKQHENK